MRLEYLLAGFLVFTLVIMTGSAMIIDNATNYNVDYNLQDVAFNSTYNHLEKIKSIVGNQSNNVLYSEMSTTDPTSSALTGAYNSVRLLPETYGLMSGVVEGVCTKLIGGGSGALSCSTYSFIAITTLSVMVLFSIIYILITRYISP